MYIEILNVVDLFILLWFIFPFKQSYEILQTTVSEEVLQEAKNASNNGPSSALFNNCARFVYIFAFCIFKSEFTGNFYFENELKEFTLSYS